MPGRVRELWIIQRSSEIEAGVSSRPKKIPLLLLLLLLPLPNLISEFCPAPRVNLDPALRHPT